VINKANASPFRKADVRFSTVEDNPTEALAITDESRRFIFSSVPPGTINLPLAAIRRLA
jgi:hypothetical protein